MSRRRRLVPVLALFTAATVAGPAGSAAAAPGCPSVDRDWAAAGPFGVTTQQSGAGHTIYRPVALGECGTHPVLLWGNGTGATPAVYDTLLRHFASHGFIVAAANTTWAGSGTAMLGGLDYLTRQNSTAGSVFNGKVDLSRARTAPTRRCGARRSTSRGRPT